MIAILLDVHNGHRVGHYNIHYVGANI